MAIIDVILVPNEDFKLATEPEITVDDEGTIYVSQGYDHNRYCGWGAPEDYDPSKALKLEYITDNEFPNTLPTALDSIGIVDINKETMKPIIDGLKGANPKPRTVELN